MTDLALLREAVADDLDMLAHLALAELDGETIRSLLDVGFPDNLGLTLAGGTPQLLRATVQALPDPSDSKERDQLDADYAALFLTNGYQAAPSESPWIDPDGLERQEATFAVRAWYQREGFSPADPLRRPDDFLAFELAFLASLLRKPGSDQSQLSLAAEFLASHPARWVPAFAAKASPRCLTPFYGSLLLFTAEYLMYLNGIVEEFRP